MIAFFFVLLISLVSSGMILGIQSLLHHRQVRSHLLASHLTGYAQMGLPLDKMLHAVGRDLRGRLGCALQRAGFQLEEGHTFKEIVTALPHVFPPMLRSALVLGDRSGNLAGFLKEVDRSCGRPREPNATLSPHLIYSFTLICISIGALLILITYVIPAFYTVFSHHGIDPTIHSFPLPHLLPIVTPLYILIFLTLPLAIFALFTPIGAPHFTRSPLHFARVITHRLSLATPFLAGILRDQAASRFALYASLFLRAGATLPEAAAAAADAEPNHLLARRQMELACRLSEGERFSKAVKSHRAFTCDFLWFVEAGEASGDLPGYLLQASAHFDTKIRFASHMAARALIPLMALLNGSIVLLTTLHVFLPLRDLFLGVGPW